MLMLQAKVQYMFKDFSFHLMLFTDFFFHCFFFAY